MNDNVYSNPDTKIVERYDSTYFDYFTYLAIGFVYVCFMSLLSDQILKYQGNDKSCDKNSDNNHSELEQRCVSDNYDNELKKYVLMLIAGFGGILVGGYLINQDPIYTTGGMGLGLGGLLAIIYYTIYNWGKFNKNVQLLILGVTLVALFYGSTKIYNY